MAQSVSQHTFSRYFETYRYRYHEIFQLMIPQHHQPSYRYFEIYRYYEIRNYEISLYLVAYKVKALLVKYPVSAKL